ncbi:hypothetical protein [Desulfobacter curvatus]|uniref:hypothetical protein n=1 Tax=Desulfobacter curvatus TaxID=2290 RepID=UPI00037B85A3|nr:hypothetical protein [Desulfobacter curvatus]
MFEQVEKPKENRSKAVANSVVQNKNRVKQSVGFVDNRQRAVAQNTIQLRAKDPYERGVVDSPQVHHIISHSKLIGGLGKLGDDDKAEVKRGFMPTDNKLTIRQIYNLNDRLVFTTNNNKVAIENRVLDRNNEHFSEMPWTEQSITSLNGDEVTITFAGIGFNNTTLTNWIASYNKVKGGQDPDVGEKDFWNALQNSYFEWSGGNLFYGAQSRAEPGGADLDAFDEDAKYFRNADHVARLKRLSEELEDAGDDTDQIKAKLLEIGAANRDEGVGPKHDRSKWYKPSNDNQKQALLEILKPGDRKDYIDTQVAHKALPVVFVRERVDDWAVKQVNDKPTLDESHEVYNYIYKGSLTVPNINGINASRTTIRNKGYKVKLQGAQSGEVLNFQQAQKIKMKDITNSINELLLKEVKVRQKINLGMQ